MDLPPERAFRVLLVTTTELERSRWRGGDTLQIMGCWNVVNRLSPLFANSLCINLLQAKVN